MGLKYFHKIKSQTQGLASYRLGTPLSKYFKTDLGSVFETLVSSIHKVKNNANICMFFEKHTFSQVFNIPLPIIYRNRTCLPDRQVAFRKTLMIRFEYNSILTTFSPKSY